MRCWCDQPGGVRREPGGEGDDAVNEEKGEEDHELGEVEHDNEGQGDAALRKDADGVCQGADVVVVRVEKRAAASGA